MEEQGASEEVEGGLGGEDFHRLAVGVEAVAFDDGGKIGGGEGDEDRAERFGGGAAGGACEARGGEGVIGGGEVAGGFGHGGGDGCADRPSGLEEFGGNAESVMFGLVGVSDKALGESGGSAWGIGEAVGEKATGAGLGGAEGLASGDEEIEHDAFEGEIFFGNEV